MSVSLQHALFLPRDNSVFSAIEDADDGLLFFLVAMEEVASSSLLRAREVERNDLI